ncbi:MAG: cobalt-precorrin-5B (C(1))-methyltransferase CbiD [Candidatus Methanomethylophilaceae archaeon]|nr:cobalt-precorrin-5B (C(1))-methyltransferase CbiD [Candidatus Methanomethylophilaceae archaeon]
MAESDNRDGYGHPFIEKGGKVLRCGHTTGTCAAAATKAAADALLTGDFPSEVVISTPKGYDLTLPVSYSSGDGSVTCTVVKDGGDDEDATNGMDVTSTVTRIGSGFVIDGGIGVGRVTRRGMDQPVGNAAINRVPRRMIESEARASAERNGYRGGLSVMISVPKGEEIASKTFNPRLGIEGGISILGTSGIVEPMSEAALIATIGTEMRMHAANGERTVLVVPGNYGKDFVSAMPGLDGDSAVKCSNFIGDMLDYASEYGLDVLLVGNIGKLVKLAGGIMNTHSKYGDARMSTLRNAADEAGADQDVLDSIDRCVMTDDALDVLDSAGLLEPVIDILMGSIQANMRQRTGGMVRTAAVMFSSKRGMLGRTELADDMIRELSI